MGAREVERGPECIHAKTTATRTHRRVVVTSQGGPGPRRGAGGSEGQGEVERGPWHTVATLSLSCRRTSEGAGEGGRTRARAMMTTLFVAGQARAWAREVEQGSERTHGTTTATRTHCRVVIVVTSQGGPGPGPGAGEVA